MNKHVLCNLFLFDYFFLATNKRLACEEAMTAAAGVNIHGLVLNKNIHFWIVMDGHLDGQKVDFHIHKVSKRTFT